MNAPRGMGKVYLVGAGPGDPGLLTIRGRECLQMADVVLYDGLANSRILQMAPQAQLISVGKHGQIPLWTQADINSKLLDLARQGLCIVRLKGGDPAVFARTAEELEVLSAAKIPFEVVPGITAALAAASYVGIPITHRQHASAVAFVTGQQQSEGEPQQIDWQALARFPGTLVFYMGVTTVGEWTSRLIANGKDPKTPAAIVRRCTWSDQTVVRCEFSQVAEKLEQPQKVRPPVIVIVGEVASLGRDFDWFTSRPLSNFGVLVTRSHEQSADVARELENLGAQAYVQPVVDVRPPENFSSLDQAIAELATKRIAGITFSSVNGVEGFFGRLFHQQHDARILADVRIAAVGPATAASLTHWGVRADIVPSAGGFSAAGLIEELADSVRGEQWIVTTTNRSGQELQHGLKERGAQVREALAYETCRVTQLRPEVAEALAQQRIQFATITSRQIAEATHTLLADFCQQVQPVSLGSKISERLSELGWPAIIQAESHTMPAMIAALLKNVGFKK